MLSAYGPEYVIQAYYKYRPASLEALALLVYADGKDRLTAVYMADMLRACAMRPQFIPPSIHELFSKKKARKKIDGASFVDKLLRTFGKGGNE